MPFGNRDNIVFASSGYNTKIRIWAKPNGQVSSHKKSLCGNIFDDDEDDDDIDNNLKKPIKDIYTRVVVENNKINK